MKCRLQSRFTKSDALLIRPGSTLDGRPSHALARIIHEHFCCNRPPVRVRTQTGRSAALTREASLGRGVAGFSFQVSSSNSEYQQSEMNNLKLETSN